MSTASSQVLEEECQVLHLQIDSRSRFFLKLGSFYIEFFLLAYESFEGVIDEASWKRVRATYGVGIVKFQSTSSRIAFSLL